MSGLVLTRRSPETMGNLNLFLNAVLHFGPHALKRDTVHPGSKLIADDFANVTNVRPSSTCYELQLNFKSASRAVG